MSVTAAKVTRPKLRDPTFEDHRQITVPYVVARSWLRGYSMVLIRRDFSSSNESWTSTEWHFRRSARNRAYVLRLSRLALALVRELNADELREVSYVRSTVR
jgi:hypothetical protein